MSTGPARRAQAKSRSWINDAATGLVMLGILLAVYLLPPDTSLSEVRREGALRICVPDDYPPLVAREPDAPGLDVEILRMVAERMGVRASFNASAAMGRGYNPRGGRITRAQCQVIAGGIVATTATRSFLDTTSPHLETGWVAVTREPDPALAERTVGVFTGLTGGDRIALGAFLRGEGAVVRVIQSRNQLVAGLENGTLDVAVTEALMGRQIAGENDWSVAWLPEPLPRDPIAFGLWKGDLTLKREIERVLAELAEEGALARLMAKYEIEPIADTIAARALVAGSGP